MKNQNGKTLLNQYIMWIAIAIIVGIIIELTIANGGLAEKFKKTTVYSANETSVNTVVE